MKDYLTGHFCFKTDIGKVRENNEDKAVALVNGRGNVLLLVLDGMGGENKGEYASSLALESIKDDFMAKPRFSNKLDAKMWIKKTIKRANSRIYQESLKDIANHGMGTTMTMVLIIKNTQFIAQIGDSRAYNLKNNSLVLLTEDQSYVHFLYKTGQIKKEEIATHPERHVLLNALGVYPSVSLDLKCLEYDFSRLLLCSDGLYNNVDSVTIESVLRNDDSVDNKCNQLISIANNNGGSDNIAVVIWEANR